MSIDKSNGLPFVSVIIPSLNVERFLDQTLGGLRTNDYPSSHFEVIVVDNGSTDRTAEIAAKYNFQTLEAKGVTISALRNLGASVAKGQILAFLDADCVPATSWLREGVGAIEHENQLVGYVYDVPEGANWTENDWFCQRDPGRTIASSLAAGNMFLSKNFFWSVGGFDESLVTGEDTELCLRLKAKGEIISDDRIRVVHLGNPKTLRAFYRREVWYGIGALGTFKVEKFDKPLIGTLIFILSIVCFVFGILQWIVFQKAKFLLLSLGLLIALLAATLYFRRRYIRGVGHALRLSLLYFVYYLGRSTSMWFILTNENYHHHSRRNTS